MGHSRPTPLNINVSLQGVHQSEVILNEKVPEVTNFQYRSHKWIESETSLVMNLVRENLQTIQSQELNVYWGKRNKFKCRKLFNSMFIERCSRIKPQLFLDWFHNIYYSQKKKKNGSINPIYIIIFAHSSFLEEWMLNIDCVVHTMAFC